MADRGSGAVIATYEAGERRSWQVFDKWTPGTIVNVSSHQARRAVHAALGHDPEARDVTSGID